MLICIELIEETRRHTFDGVMTYCHIFGSVKNHINISHPIRDIYIKT